MGRSHNIHNSTDRLRALGLAAQPSVEDLAQVHVARIMEAYEEQAAAIRRAALRSSAAPGWRGLGRPALVLTLVMAFLVVPMLAVAGTLPEPAQRAVARAASVVGLRIPDGVTAPAATTRAKSSAPSARERSSSSATTSARPAEVPAQELGRAEPRNTPEAKQAARAERAERVKRAERAERRAAARARAAARVAPNGTASTEPGSERGRAQRSATIPQAAITARADRRGGGGARPKADRSRGHGPERPATTAPAATA